jgi:hypothetical protein
LAKVFFVSGLEDCDYFLGFVDCFPDSGLFGIGVIDWDDCSLQPRRMAWLHDMSDLPTDFSKIFGFLYHFPNPVGFPRPPHLRNLSDGQETPDVFVQLRHVVSGSWPGPLSTEDGNHVGQMELSARMSFFALLL